MHCESSGERYPRPGPRPTTEARAQARFEQAPPAWEQVDGMEPTETAIPTILVVDDNVPLLRIISRALSREGYMVLVAAHGGIALEIVRSRRVDLMITDLLMPEQEGIETIMTLRREQH